MKIKILFTRPYGVDNDLNIFGDYNGLQVRVRWKSNDKGIFRRAGRTYWLVGAKKGTIQVKDRRVSKSQWADLLYNFFLQQKGTRISVPA